MAISIKAKNVGTTKSALEFYETYKEAFGKVVRAEMTAQKPKVDYKFKLTNDKDEEMIFEGELTSGYGGEGPRGTLNILQSAEFDVDDNFIKNNSSFKLEK